MPEGRHVEGRRSRRAASPSTWIAAAAGLCVAGAVAFAVAPAQAAAQTVPVQLTLSGLASSDNPTGGAQVGVHPGDSVVLSSAAIPTAGAPAGLSDALAGLVSGVAGVQVKILPGNSLPGLGGKSYVLGEVAHCGGHASLPLRSMLAGTYSFSYVVQKVTLLTSLLGAVTGCQQTTVTPTQDQLGTLTQNNVKVTDNAVYSGRIVVAKNPPSGQIGVQLPSQSVSVKAGPVSTSVQLPGATITAPNPVPSITSAIGSAVGGLPGVGGKSRGHSGGTAGGGTVHYTPPPLTVPEQVMPHAVHFGGSGGSGTTGGGFAAPRGNPGLGAPVVAPPVTSTAAPVPTTLPSPDTTPAKKNVDLSGKQQLSGTQLPVLLAILAMLALSLVTAMYARLYLAGRKK